MSLQRRLLVYLLICAPLVWGVALAISAAKARHEVNELFDTELIRLARQVQVLTAGQGILRPEAPSPPPTANDVLGGEADLEDLALAVWDRTGQRVLVDREGAQLPWRADASGFSDQLIDDEAWRIFYLQAPQGQWLVAAGQRMYERDELVWGLLGSQLLPWLLVLPLLLAAMAWAVRTALAPMRELADELGQRGADNLGQVVVERAPSELQPLLAAMNGLFARIDDTLARERRFTADAAHELRTPISVLAAQWSVYRGASGDAERERASRALDAGLARLSRLVDQMLGLSRLEATDRLKDPQPLDWPALVEQVVSDVLPLAERRHVELACDWGDAPGAEGASPAWRGDASLMGLLLRNLLDNAVRYAPERSTVWLRFSGQDVCVENQAPPGLRTHDLADWGERYHRPDGQSESGSGLGVSIARRIAELHGLALAHRLSADGQHVQAVLSER
ncbi:sensor histidine kinase N-terminal domain-containing protein [Hydrogenophaga sp. XSHU_21]